MATWPSGIRLRCWIQSTPIKFKYSAAAVEWRLTSLQKLARAEKGVAWRASAPGLRREAICGERSGVPGQLPSEKLLRLPNRPLPLMPAGLPCGPAGPWAGGGLSSGGACSRSWQLSPKDPCSGTSGDHFLTWLRQGRGPRSGRPPPSAVFFLG